MTAFKLKGFSGLSPRTGRALLNDNEAQIANNVRLYSGEIRSWNGVASERPAPNLEFVPETIFRAEGLKVGYQWMAWETDVDAVNGPIYDINDFRVYYTGDGVPKKTNSILANTDYQTVVGPSKAMYMGVPNPVVKPIAFTWSDGPEPATETTIKETRVYCYTYVNKFGDIEEESGPSPASDQVTLQPDGSVGIYGFAYWGAPPAGCEPYNIVAVRIYRSVITENDTVWLFTKEIRFDGTISLFKFYDNYLDFTHVLPQKDEDGGDVYGIWDKRIDTWLGIVDDLLAINLGETLESDGYEPPPDNLSGLTVMANGFLAGFVDNKIYFTPPYRPHAWPPSYALTVDSPVVAMSAFGQSLVIATQSVPYIATGTDPAQMTLDKMPLDAPCVSKKSIASDESGVMYASLDGIVSVGPAGVQINSRNLVTREEWTRYNPHSMVGAILDGKYYLFYEVGSEKKGLVFDRYSPTSPLTTIDFHTHATFVEAKNTSMYLYDEDRNSVVVWNVDPGNPLTYKWRSKLFILTQPENFGAYDIDANFRQIKESQEAIVAADAQRQLNIALMQGNVRGAVNATWVNRLPINGSLIRPVNNFTLRSLMFRAFADEELVWEQNIIDSRIYRLPSGFYSDQWEFEIEGNVDVRQIKIGEVVKDLKSL